VTRIEYISKLNHSLVFSSEQQLHQYSSRKCVVKRWVKNAYIQSDKAGNKSILILFITGWNKTMKNVICLLMSHDNYFPYVRWRATGKTLDNHHCSDSVSYRRGYSDCQYCDIIPLKNLPERHRAENDIKWTMTRHVASNEHR